MNAACTHSPPLRAATGKGERRPGWRTTVAPRAKRRRAPQGPRSNRQPQSPATGHRPKLPPPPVRRHLLPLQHRLHHGHPGAPNLHRFQQPVASSTIFWYNSFPLGIRSPTNHFIIPFRPPSVPALQQPVQPQSPAIGQAPTQTHRLRRSVTMSSLLPLQGNRVSTTATPVLPISSRRCPAKMSRPRPEWEERIHHGQF